MRFLPPAAHLLVLTEGFCLLGRWTSVHSRRTPLVGLSTGGDAALLGGL